VRDAQRFCSCFLFDREFLDSGIIAGKFCVKKICKDERIDYALALHLRHIETSELKISFADFPQRLSLGVERVNALKQRVVILTASYEQLRVTERAD